MASNTELSESIQEGDTYSQENQDNPVREEMVWEKVNSTLNSFSLSRQKDQERIDQLERELDYRFRRSRSRSAHRSRRYRSRSPHHHHRRSRRHRSRSYRRSVSRSRRSQNRSPEEYSRGHYSGTHDSRKRERSRSHSESNRSRSCSVSNSESDSSERNSSGESPRRNRRKYSEYAESFLHDGDMYVFFNRNQHTMVESDSTRIFWGENLISVKWHPDSSKKAFCKVSSTSKDSPYMEKGVSHDTLLNNLKITPHAGVNPGLRRRGFNSSLDPDSGLSLALDIIRSRDEPLMHHLIADNIVAAMKEIPDDAFDTSSMAIFSTWPNGDYLDWAKGENLDLTKVAVPLDVVSTAKVNRDFQTDERDARALLVNNLTGLRATELFSENFKDELPKKTTALALAKLFLPNIKYFVIKWMSAKMRLRKEILHNQDNPLIRILLRSNMWDASIFPKEAFEELKNTKASDGVRNKLNLDKNGGLAKKPYDNPKYNHGKASQNNKRRSYDGRHQRDSFRNKHDYKRSQRDSHPNYERKPISSEKSEGDRDANSEGSFQPKNSIKKGKNFHKGRNNKKGGKFNK